MLHEQTMHKLYAMKFRGMAEAYEEQLQQAQIGDLSFEDRFTSPAYCSAYCPAYCPAYCSAYCSAYSLAISRPALDLRL